MFKKIITEAQKDEIVKLANSGYTESLIAYGADIYRQGLCKGAIIGVTGIVIAFLAIKLTKCGFTKKLNKTITTKK